jgi:multidrug resistance efflux pump
MLWAFKAHLTRYELSDSASLEMDGAPYPVQASTAGKITFAHMTLGQQVESGEVLAEVDSEDQRLSLQQDYIKAAEIKPQLAALEAQMQSENDGRAVERKVLGFSTASARAQYEEAEAQAQLAETNAKRAGQLRADGIMAKADAEKAEAEARSKREAAESLRAALTRLEPELQVRERDRDVKLREKQGEAAKLEADLADAEANIRRLQYEIDRRRIRATVSGKLGDCALLRPGSHVVEGQQLAVIIPAGKLQIISEFQPSAALGKVRPGQHAVMRLDGFPWAQYGTVHARVARVASEIRDGKVRVELAVDPGGASLIPFQHGLPGRVEVETGRITPAALILRSAGEWVATR